METKEATNKDEIKVKLKDAVNFYNTAGMFISQNKLSKLTYAVDKIKGKLETVVDKYNDHIEDTKVELASSDSDGNIMLSDDNNSYKYTKENTKKLNKEVRDYNKKLVTIKPHIVSFDDIPKTLNPNWLDILIPFVIKEEDKFDILEMLESNKDTK